jgi:transaldolase
VLHDIAAVGVDYDDVVDLLEGDGITKFEASWDLVTAELSDRLRATSPTSHRS